MESFNFPIYYPTAKEFLGIIERNGSFSIEKMEILSNPPILNMKFSAEFVTSNIRAVFEGIIKEHFGSELVDQIFSHFTKNFAENAFILEDIKDQKKDNSFFLLKRIVNWYRFIILSFFYVIYSSPIVMWGIHILTSLLF